MGESKIMRKLRRLVSCLVPISVKVAIRRRLTLIKYGGRVRRRGVNDMPRKEFVVVSLTSYPARINAIYLTIQTLLKQTYKPDRLVLWLGIEQFPEKEVALPKKILGLKDYGLEIRWTKDIRSYKKLIPALKEFPNAIIVTADDDVFYPNFWLGKLIESYREYPFCVNCHRGHTIKWSVNGDAIEPFSKWDYESSRKEPSFLNFATGVGGVLYPPHALYPDVDNEALFMEIAPTCDDHWFWAMAVLQGTKIKIVGNGLSSFMGLINPKASSEYSLCDINKGADFKSNDDTVFAQLCQSYPDLLTLLTKEKMQNRH